MIPGQVLIERNIIGIQVSKLAVFPVTSCSHVYRNSSS